MRLSNFFPDFFFNSQLFIKGLGFFLFCFCLFSERSAIADPPASVKKPSEVKADKKSSGASLPEVQATPPAGEAKQEAAKNNEAATKEIPPYLETPVKIHVSFLLDDITRVNEAAGTFEGTVDIEIEWRDPQTAYDPTIQNSFRKKLCGNEAVEALSKIWNPDIVIANMDQKPSKVEQCLFILPDGTVTYVQRVKGVFQTMYNLKAFPFDTQSLNIVLRSNRYNDQEVQLVQGQEQINKSGIREGVSFSGWNLEGVDYSFSNTRALDGTFYSIFEAKSIISRKPLNDLLAFLPLLIIVFIPTFVTLYSDKDIGTRFAGWSGAILALIALNFTLNSRYPALGSDSLLASLISIIFIYQFVMIALSMTVLERVKEKNLKNPYLLQEFVEFLRWGIPIGMFILICVEVLLTKYA